VPPFTLPPTVAALLTPPDRTTDGVIDGVPPGCDAPANVGAKPDDIATPATSVADPAIPRAFDHRLCEPGDRMCPHLRSSPAAPNAEVPCDEGLRRNA
jgi:hypothetical protein